MDSLNCVLLYIFFKVNFVLLYIFFKALKNTIGQCHVNSSTNINSKFILNMIIHNYTYIYLYYVYRMQHSIFVFSIV